MKEKERDTFDDLFRSKLQDFEADTMPGDWEAISKRLPGKTPVVPFRRTLRYWAAAAVISLLVISSGVYMFNQDKQQNPVADVIREKTDAVESRLAEQKSQSVSVFKEDIPSAQSAPYTAVATPTKGAKKVVIAQAAPANYRMRVTDEAVKAQTEETTPATDAIVEEQETDVTEKDTPVQIAIASDKEADKAVLTADAPKAEKPVKNVRRWSFGMGGGSVSAGTNSSINTYALKNTLLVDDQLMYLNSPYFDAQAPKTNINHKTPVTVGVGVGYQLSDRFSLQSGLNYTFLSSSWETNGKKYHTETKQKLHFIGLPLSLSYKIAEWNRVQFYAAAGGMLEVNVAGKLNYKIFSNADEFSRETDRVRMKEPMWSVNGRVGASYPLWRFLSLYAEVGASYYFDNGSLIETIRSEKPFNVNLQAGFRFGF